MRVKNSWSKNDKMVKPPDAVSCIGGLTKLFIKKEALT